MKRLFAVAALAALIVAAPAAEKFDFAVLQAKARDLAARPYAEPVSTVPAWLRGYTYDQHRKIVFNEKQTFWLAERLPFRMQFFHPGWLQHLTVQIHTVVGGQAQLVPFSTKMFIYGEAPAGAVPEDMGYAGLKLNAPFNEPGKFDEVAAFLGASYFRALGAGQRYGLSARGLAINTAEPGGEEFPRFSEFWVEQPTAGTASITVYALLDGPSVTGAYRFVITPGADTVMQVKAAVFCRRNPAVLGLAPLTSMFLHGENTGWSREDFRPEVHDSDGLLLATGQGEWLWRPLNNPKAVRTAAFLDKSPRGFGLFQRDRDFAHYDDFEAHYHQRPSAWVEPVGDWGEGAVRLVEIPTPDETNDNIVAFWVPAHLPAPGTPIEFSYILHWLTDPAGRPPGGYVESTRTASVLSHPELRRFVLEFNGAALRALPADPAPEAVVDVGAGARLDGQPVVFKNSVTGAWRVAFVIAPEPGGGPVELRCHLRAGGQVLTETWSHLWTP